MKEKLTLSINKKTIALSKKLAKKKGVSLSRFIEDYLNESVAGIDDMDTGNETILGELVGCIALDEGKDYKTLIEEARAEKAKENESTH